MQTYGDNKLFYDDGQGVFCPRTKEQCTLLCPLVQKVLGSLWFYCSGTDDPVRYTLVNPELEETEDLKS